MYFNTGHCFQDAIKAVTEAQGGGLVYVTGEAGAAPRASISQLQHPIPQKELGDVKPLMTSSTIPRSGPSLSFLELNESLLVSL